MHVQVGVSRHFESDYVHLRIGGGWGGLYTGLAYTACRVCW